MTTYYIKAQDVNTLETEIIQQPAYSDSLARAAFEDHDDSADMNVLWVSTEPTGPEATY